MEHQLPPTAPRSQTFHESVNETFSFGRPTECHSLACHLITKLIQMIKSSRFMSKENVSKRISSGEIHRNCITATPHGFYFGSRFMDVSHNRCEVLGETLMVMPRHNLIKKC